MQAFLQVAAAGRLRLDALDVQFPNLTVAGNVEALVKEEDVRIFADRLLADPANSQLELFGTPDAPASAPA